MVAHCCNSSLRSNGGREIYVPNSDQYADLVREIKMQAVHWGEMGRLPEPTGSSRGRKGVQNVTGGKTAGTGEGA